MLSRVRFLSSVARRIFRAAPATHYQFCQQNKLAPTSKLLKIVEKELTYEQQNYQTDETVQDFLKQAGLELIENDTTNQVQLKKNVDGATVSIYFESRTPSTDEQENQQEEQQQGQQPQKEEGEQQQEPQDYSDFTVYIQKNGETKAMCFECSSVSTELQINMVCVVEDILKHQKIPKFERGISEYCGPEFSSLDERLQASFFEYLKKFGVNEELAAFIEHYSLDKEQRLYMSWLAQLQNYLKN